MRKLPFFKAFPTLFVFLTLAACNAAQPPGDLVQGVTAAPATPASMVKQISPPTKPSALASFTPTIQVAPQPTATPTVAPAWPPCSPLADTPLSELPKIISDPYHPPPMGKDDRHQGVDFSYYRRGERLSIQGAGIQAVFAGTVAAAVSDSFPFGNNLIIETPAAVLPLEIRQQFNIQDGESVYVLYAHMESPPELKLGQAVAACQALGTVGKTGNAGVAHLHLEMRHGPAGAQFPSMAFYKPDDTPDEHANYLLWATSGTFLHFDPMELLHFQQ